MKTLIGSEELWVLNDIKHNCYFPNADEGAAFTRLVCKSVRVKAFKDISEDDFETAFNAAIFLLRTRGEEILQGKHQSDKLAQRVG